MEQGSSKGYYRVRGVDWNLSEEREVLTAMRKGSNVGGRCMSEENERQSWEMSALSGLALKAFIFPGERTMGGEQTFLGQRVGEGQSLHPSQSRSGS